ncbi:LGFP repeat-containing protein, partial [Mycobacterium sp. 1423905.2]|uniref:LGFP repeat-containing protein n=1 Tax=Mycobacterium sp. 1423905.2 TaxID=1856859 RepID=UPI0009F716D1
MSGQRGQLSRLVGRALVSLAATAVLAVFAAPTVVASPIGDAEAAMMAAWEKAGGDTSTLGARKGDVYPVGDGFALDFDAGRMYFTPATGAKYMYGPILDKYQALGGPDGSDLGFPTINEVPGLAGPDSRVSTFSASDNPVIFWTPDHGAFVVRGALNAAWDKLGSSGGVIGVPVGDETYDGEVTAQKFSGGEISWNRKTKQFNTTPPALADQLKDLQVAIDPTAAINMAWRAAGGASGPLGAKKGGQYPIGGDGVAQDFAGGKVFFSPATGANAVESDILAKYESLGGPVSSDLGFPVSNEADGGVGPSSRVAMFAAADKPVIFWTPDHGAFVVRGAMKAAWDKLKGASGKLGAPVADQTVDGDVISQKFTGGKISWNRARNTFSTDPANLAPLLSGLQVSGQNQPSASTPPAHGKGFTWHWWWLAAAVPVLLLIVMSVLVINGMRRRRARPDTAAYPSDLDAYARERDPDAGYEPAGDARWSHDDTHQDLDYGTERFPLSDENPPDHAAEEAEAAPRVSWRRGAEGPAEEAEPVRSPGAYDVEHDFEAREDEDPDSVDTTPIRPVTEAELVEPITPEPHVPETAAPEAFAVPETVADEVVVPETHLADSDVPRYGVSADTDLADAVFPDTFYPSDSRTEAFDLDAAPA